MAKTTND